MTQLVLYYAPDTCARVTMIALEEAGVAYEPRLVSFVRGDTRAPEYARLNPRGKVPVLVIDGEPLTENVAILSWLAKRFPEAGLLPKTDHPVAEARIMADLAWCASGLHPFVTRMRLPQYFCALPEARENVRNLAEQGIRAEYNIVEARLKDGPWWYGDNWSILDAYINWTWFRVTGCGLDAADYPRLSDHDRRLRERPSVKRALDIHARATRELAEKGLAVNFDKIGAQPTAQAKS